MKGPSSMKQKSPPMLIVDPRASEQRQVGFGQGRAPGWKATRARILARDGGVCQCYWCKESGEVKLAHEVDHIDNRRGPGYDDDRNLQAISRDCHWRKSQLEAKIARGLADRPDWMIRKIY